MPYLWCIEALNYDVLSSKKNESPVWDDLAGKTGREAIPQEHHG